MQIYNETIAPYCRLKTREVSVGNLLLGNGHPIRVQTMTTTDTMDTAATVAQTIRCIEAGAELVRITAPSKKEAENLWHIKNELHARGYKTPLVADIHFTPNAAEIAARIIEKVRVNPGNYVDKKKFELIEYTDIDYAEEIERISERFLPLVKICKEYGTAMRIGTNHGSLSDRIMSRYGDTPMGMVESAMEFLRIARTESYHNIVLSMKSSNPQVMVEAYRMLVRTMQDEFGELYPLHLGVTEAGDGEDGRIKSAVGIGTLLEEGLGDTIRVSLTEDPELEIPVCKDIVKRYSRYGSIHSAAYEGGANSILTEINDRNNDAANNSATESQIEDNNNSLRRSTPAGAGGSYSRRDTFPVSNIGGSQVPVVIADLSKLERINPSDLQSIGYKYNEATDKWTISDGAADYIFTGNILLRFALPGTLKVFVYPAAWEEGQRLSAGFGKEALQLFNDTYFPIYNDSGYATAKNKSALINFVMLDCSNETSPFTHLHKLANDPTVVLCLSSTHAQPLAAMRWIFAVLAERNIKNPAVIMVNSNWITADEHLIHYATEAGALLLDGFGDGVWFGMSSRSYKKYTEAYTQVSGRNYQQAGSVEQFINNTAFSILQATRTRISKTEYISCPSCGRTLFDLQETTARIRAVTAHLKGLKIAIMGCIVNGPGEMADADFGYVGSGPGKITLYKSKEVVKRNVPSETAVDELINLLKESGAWVEKEAAST